MNKMDIILSKIENRTDKNSLLEILDELNIGYTLEEKENDFKTAIEESIVKMKTETLTNEEIISSEFETYELPLIKKKSIHTKTIFALDNNLFEYQTPEGLIA